MAPRRVAQEAEASRCDVRVDGYHELVTETKDSSASVTALLRRLWDAIVLYKGMVAAMIVFGFLEAMFTKLPFVLVKPLMAEMGAADRHEPLLAAPWHPPLAAPEQLGWFDRLLNDFNDAFRSFATEMVGWFGLSFTHPGMNVVVACGVIAVLCDLFGAVTIYFVQTISRLFAIRIVADLRSELACHFLALPIRFFGRQRMGEMISKVTNDTQVMQRSFELAADNIVVDPMMILWNIGILA